MRHKGPLRSAWDKVKKRLLSLLQSAYLLPDTPCPLL